MAIVARLETRRAVGEPAPGGRPGLPGLRSAVELQVEGAHAWIGSDADRSTARADGFAAGWVRELDEPGGPSIEAVRASRAGSFAVASSRGLEIERGPYGGRPLYYAQDGAGVTVASGLAALVSSLSERPPLDVDRLGAMGVTRTGPDPRATVYRGVRRLLPCESIQFAPDGTRRSTFRLPVVPEPSRGDARDHSRAILEALELIIARELRPFSAVGVEAGGGLDSAGLLALVSRYARRTGSLRFTALTMDFAGPGDDRPHLRALLDHLHAGTLRVSPSEVGPIPMEFFEQDASPNTGPVCPVGHLLDRRAKEWGAQAILTGFGGDFVLDGDLDGFADRVRNGDLGAAVDAARLQVPWESSAATQLFHFVVKPLLQPMVPPAWLARRRARWLATSEAARWAGPRLLPLLPQPVSSERNGDDWLTSFATSYEMMEGADGVGQTEAAWGTHCVDPYVDPRFIELVASIPPEQMFFGGRMRGLFRASMAGLIPDSVRFRRDKAGFEPLIDEMFASAGGLDAFDELLTMEATADLGLVNPAAFRQTFAKVVRKAPTARGWLEVWPMLAIEAFVRGSDSRPSHAGLA